MRYYLQSLDRLLRGELTHLEALRKDGLQLPLGGTALMVAVLGMLFGVCMGTYAVLHQDGPRLMQMLAASVKVPALFLLTLLVTFPSLYVFNALVGSQLRFVANLRLLVGALGITLAVLASFGPIIAFFSVSTTSYPFMKVLNVLAFAIAGGLGLTFLLQTLHRLSVVDLPASSPLSLTGSSVAAERQAPAADGANLVEAIVIAPQSNSPIEPVPGYILGRHVKTVFRCWAIVFGLVGAQMGWILRPFIGDPSQPFTWLRPRTSNFFEDMSATVWKLFT
jgi:hypothetical protein